MASEFASHVEIHWPDGKVEKWSSIRVLRVNTVIRDDDGSKDGVKRPIQYLTVTLVEGEQDGNSSPTA